MRENWLFAGCVVGVEGVVWGIVVGFLGGVFVDMSRSEMVNEAELDACLRCGYSIACRDGVVCSECGHLYTAEDVAVVRRRGELVEGAKGRVWGAVVGWLGVWVFYVSGGLGAMWMVEPHMSWDVVFFMVGALSVLIWGSLGAGWGASRFAPEHQREVLWLSWLQTLPSVHLSWLSIAGFTGIGAVVALVVGTIEGAGEFGVVLMGYVAVAFLAWFIGSLVLIAVWVAKFGGLLREYEVVKSQPGTGLLWLLAVLAWFAGCVVGFAGGVLGVGVISSLY